MNRLRHLAVIMDGNGRWAEQRGLPRWKGHEMGMQAVRRLIEAACRRDIPVLTVFAFSSENWKRPQKEVRMLFTLFHRYLVSERQNLLDNGIRISAVGRRDRIPGIVREVLAATESATEKCSRLHFRIALDYGARHEIVETARSLARAVLERRIEIDQITEDLFSRTISSDEVPDPDFIIRTAGERRLSNFLLWQAAYAELCFLPKLWPDFDESDLENILDDYYSRTRKFGALAAPAPQYGNS
ncbi:MAG: di-trans,poly-cis-decaprenylcistransferase [Acidobacteria bacterium]|nr:di-trans,poly-cis-decaprenylcistransferase [Acidobacteriota bacterium]